MALPETERLIFFLVEPPMFSGFVSRAAIKTNGKI